MSAEENVWTIKPTNSTVAHADRYAPPVRLAKTELVPFLAPRHRRYAAVYASPRRQMQNTAENAETHAQPKSPMPTPMPSHVSAVLAKFGNVNPATPQILQIQPVSKMPSQDALPILTVLPHYNQFATHPQVYVSNV